MNANGASTFLQIVKARYGTASHVLFTVSSPLRNLLRSCTDFASPQIVALVCIHIVSGSLVLGASSTVNAMTGMPIVACNFRELSASARSHVPADFVGNLQFFPSSSQPTLLQVDLGRRSGVTVSKRGEEQGRREGLGLSSAFSQSSTPSAFSSSYTCSSSTYCGFYTFKRSSQLMLRRLAQRYLRNRGEPWTAVGAPPGVCHHLTCRR